MHYAHPNAARIVTDFEAWATIASDDREQAAQASRNSELVALRAKAPLQSKGRPVEDAGHLPLFVAADEPGLPL